MRYLRLTCLLLLLPVAATLPGRAQQPQGYRVSGIVVNDISGEPLTNCIVRLMARVQQGTSPTPQTESSERDVRTDERGYFLFEGVSPGKYRLIAEKRGFPARAYEEHGFFSSAIVTGPNQDTGNLIFRLIPSSLIFGFVVDEASEPVRNAQIQLYRSRQAGSSAPGWQRVNATMSDDRGRFEFADLNPGEYYLSVNARPWYEEHSTRHDAGSDTDQPQNPKLDVTYPTTYYPGVTDFNAAEPLTLKGGNQVEADIALSPIPSLHLRIQVEPNSRNQWLSYSLMQKLPDGTTSYVPMISRRTQDLVEITGLAPGKYQLEMARHNLGSPSVAATESNREIDITGNTTLDERSDSTAEETSLTGKVLLPPGPPTQFRPIVEFQPAQSPATNMGRLQNTTVQQDGGFQINLPAGQYRIFLRNAGPVFIEQMAAEGAKVSGRTITIQSGQQSARLVIQMSSGVASVEGFAQRGEKAASAVAVALVPEDPQESVDIQRRDQSNSDGSFEMQRILPGRYYLVAVERGWEIDWTNPAAVRPYLAHALLLDIKPGDKLHKDIQVQPR